VRQTSIIDVANWIAELDIAATGNKYSEPRFLKPFHFAMLAATCQRLGDVEQIVWEGPLIKFATRMQLWNALGLKPPTHVRKNAHAGRFLPLTALRNPDAVHEYSDQLCAIAANQGQVSEETSQSLFIALTEILHNCFAHAAVIPNCKGMTCAQTWPRGNLVQIAVVDPGIGIRASLSENALLASRLRRENACGLATELNITGKPNGHSGYGLTVAKELMAQNGGNFILVSGTEAYRREQNREIRRNLLRQGWQGTIVIMEWRTDRPLDIGAVYESWPLPEGMTHEDFNL
jgi:anti-sigma regulatory factor (Ser/Thr protein kinase)